MSSALKEERTLRGQQGRRGPELLSLGFRQETLSTKKQGGGGGRKRKQRKPKAEEVNLVFCGELCPHKEPSLSGRHPAVGPSLAQPMDDTWSFNTFFFLHGSPALKDLAAREYLQSNSPSLRSHMSLLLGTFKPSCPGRP